MGKTWPYSKTCIRPKGHSGKCQGIENGMTAAEADDISNGVVATWREARGG
jgi:hypothetical protein